MMKSLESIQNPGSETEGQSPTPVYESFQEHMKKKNQDIADDIHTDEIIMDPDPNPEQPEPDPEPEPEEPAPVPDYEPEPTLESTPEPEPEPEPTPTPDYDYYSTNKVTPEAKERIMDAAIRRDEASRIRLDFAGNEGLSLEEQDKILDKEIAIEEADKELIEDLASDDSTVGSIDRKLGKSLQAVADATEIRTEDAPKPDSDGFEKIAKDLGL